jgi:DNA-binding NarL/FixJ family response regulator
MSNSISVLIADDHPVFREGLTAVISGDDRMHVVGEACDAPAAVAGAARLRPDVILMDLSMPGGGLEATRTILTADPGARIMVLTTSDDHDTLFAALRAGARGYLLKDAGKDTIRSAIVGVAAGQAVFGPRTADAVVESFRRATGKPGAFPQLSNREREILDLIAAGLSNTAIARRLMLSEKTVRNNISMIFTKIQAADRAQAIVIARQAGLGQHTR